MDGQTVARTAMWQYMLDEDHFYDLRDLPVGGWQAAYLGCRVEYPWRTFSRARHLPPINPVRRVHYDGAYRPPPKHGDIATAPQTRAVSPLLPEFTMTRRSLNAMNDEDDLTRRTLPEIHERRAPSRKAAGDLFTRSLRESARPKTTMVTRRSAVDIPMVVLENDALPDRECKRNHRVGEDPGRWPFRVSQIEIRRQFQAAFKQSLAEKVKRPSTTAPRFPHLLDVSGKTGRRSTTDF
jgi:hypothetical protein